MKCLITGGAGFIGSHLAEALIHQGHNVRVIDDLSTGSLKNLKCVRTARRFEFHRASIHDEKFLKKVMRGCGVVFHLAAAVGVKLIVDSPVRTIETNILGSENVLRLASDRKIKVILASTSEVYGKSTAVPFREDQDLILGPTFKSRWSYACSKAIDEFLALAYWKEKKLPIVIVRLFNTVGPRQTGRYGMVLPTFVKQALANKSITVYGKGDQSRCFTHVSDVVAGLIRLSQTPTALGQVFNMGSRQEISINALAERVIRLTKSKSRVQHIPYSKAYEEGFEDMQRRVPDLTKIKRFIGYKPSKTLDDIIKDVIEFRK
jgi:UDP-glucose 4-epimerase